MNEWMSSQGNLWNQGFSIPAQRSFCYIKMPMPDKMTDPILYNKFIQLLRTIIRTETSATIFIVMSHK